MKHEEKKKIVDSAPIAVLFLHGIIGSPHHFEKFYDIIPENVSYHAVLLEGHGGSVKEFGRAKMKNWKKQVCNALESLRQTHDKLIIVGHSMGTLFAIQETIKNSDKIVGLILIDSPMKAYLHPVMIKYSCQFLLKLSCKRNPRSIAAMDVISVKSDILIWRYLSWIPRFLELFTEIRSTRPLVSKLNCKTVFYHSKDDELVPKSAIKYIEPHKNVDLHILENSTHFYYSEEDIKIPLKNLEDLLAEYVT